MGHRGGASPDEADAIWYVTGKRSFKTSFFTKAVTISLSGGKVSCNGVNVSVSFANDQLKTYGDLAMEVPEWARPTGAISEAYVNCKMQGSSTNAAVDLDYRDGAFYLGAYHGNESYTGYSVKSFSTLYMTYECSSQPAVTGGEPVSLDILRQCI